MASGAQPPPQPAASKEVKSDPRLCGHPGERTNEMALSLLLPPPRWNISLPTATQRMFLEACQPGAARLPEPSRRRSRRLAAQTRRAAGPAAAAAAPPPPSFGPESQMVPCDSEGLLDERRLAAHLKLALRREARLWRGGHPQQVGFGDTFQEVVLRLLRLENIFHFSQGTFNLALTIFRRLLVSVKIKERLLHCVTITSLRLAAKVNEEEELIPHIKDFIKHYGSGYTSNELLRMELAILDKLHWDLYIGTPLDFLTIFHTLVVVGWPHMVELLPQRNPSLHVASLTRQLQHCMAGHQLLQFKGSTLALVIITLELERLMPDWCTPISDLLKKAQVTIEQLVRCRALIKQQLRNLQSSSCTDNFVSHVPACAPIPVSFRM